MTRRTRSPKRRFERDYPYGVDVPVPPYGLGKRLDEMVAWCREHTPNYAVMGVRFYFKSENEAELVSSKWLADK